VNQSTILRKNIKWREIKIYGGIYGCPGSHMRDFLAVATEDKASEGKVNSQLQQWPVQMHLISTDGPYFQGSRRSVNC